MKSPTQKRGKLLRAPVEGGNIRISTDQRVFIAGITGSGKTFLSHLMLYPVNRLLLIDTKDDLFDWNTENWSKSSARDFRNPKKDVRARVTDPKIAFEAMEALWEGANGVVYVDEVSQLFKASAEPPQVVLDIWQRGRSRAVGGWSASQRPHRIPLLFMSEVQHFFCFYLNVLDDRKRMAEFMGSEVTEPPQDEHGFWYFSVLERRLEYWPKITIPS